MPTSESGRVSRALIALVGIIVVVVGVGIAFNRGVGPLPNPEGCSAHVAGIQVDLSTEQAQNASVIAAIGVRRGLPARAVSIALATAYQESKLVNLDHGDRDSLGLFQQRPSQGWGTAHQVENPYYAANRFYDELVKVHGYQHMRITDAAQRVQRSGFPDAYSAHAEEARALASALTGYSPAGFSCVVHSSSGGAAVAASGTALVRKNLRHAFGHLRVTGHDNGVRVRVSDTQHGWAVAHYLVAQAERLGVTEVRYDGRVWSAGSRSEQGWRRVPGSGSRDVRVSVTS
jgi:hypothetical protein